MFQVIAGTAGVRGPRPGSPAGVLDPPAMSAKRENRLNDTTLEKLRACNALPARRPQSQQKVASNCHGSPSFKDSSLTTSYKVLASWREVWRAVGTARTRTVIRVWWRRMEISSPTLIAWDDFAIFPLIETRCASQSFWPSVRRAASRLALRKRSRRMKQLRVSSSKFRVNIKTRNSKLGTRNLVYGFGKIPSSLPFFFFSPGCSPPLGIPAVFSGVTFNIGYTAAA